MVSNLTRYYYNIDVVKFFCVIAVVLIHMTVFLSQMGLANIYNYYLYRYLFDIAVPFFFATSGFFLSTKSGTGYIKLYSIKILTMYIAFSILYVIVRLFYNFTDRIILEVPFWPSLRETIGNLSITSVLNGTIGSYHLWFLSALFFAGLLLLMCIHFSLKPKTIFLLAFILYMTSLSNVINLEELTLYGGFPKGFFYLAMGYYIGSNRIQIRFSAIVFALSIIAYSIIQTFSPTDISELLLGLAAFSLLVICTKTHGTESFLSKLGGHTLSIYILHVLIYESILKIFTYYGNAEYYYTTISTISVSVLSIILPIVLYKSLDKVFVKPVSSFLGTILK